MGSASVTVGVSDGIGLITTSISEYVGNNPATISNLVAYDSDNVTPISGGSSSTGSASGIHLDFDINPLVEDESTVLSSPDVEVKATGSSFTGSATASIPDLWYNSDEPMGMYESPIVWDSIQNRFLMFGGYANDTSA